MRLEKLLETPAPVFGSSLLRETKVEVAGGTVQITYLPPPAGAVGADIEEFLGRHLLGWNVEGEGGTAALNADVIHALAPAVKDAFRDAILGKKKAADKPAEKPAAAAHTSVEPEPLKPTTVTSRPGAVKHE
jgi:hypothetical protein